MKAEKKPFHQKEYTNVDGCYFPILDVICWFKNSKKDFPCLADTGCNPGVCLSKDHVVGIDLGEKINDEPVEIFVADGHVIGADTYQAIVEIDGEKREIELCVIDPTNIIKFEITSLCPLLGREFLDKFDVHFKGEEKKIVLLK